MGGTKHTAAPVTKATFASAISVGLVNCPPQFQLNYLGIAETSMVGSVDLVDVCRRERDKDTRETQKNHQAHLNTCSTSIFLELSCHLYTSQNPVRSARTICRVW